MNQVRLSYAAVIGSPPNTVAYTKVCLLLMLRNEYLLEGHSAPPHYVMTAPSEHDTPEFSMAEEESILTSAFTTTYSVFEVMDDLCFCNPLIIIMTALSSCKGDREVYCSRSSEERRSNYA